GVTSCLRGSDVPRDLPRADEIYGGDDDWMARGNTTICGPDGEILAGPLEGQEGIVYAAVDADHARKVRRQFDPIGHYSRAEVLRLVVDREAKTGVVFAGQTPQDAPLPADEPVEGRQSVLELHEAMRPNSSG
ncbi:MAG TPA: nitrilase-related carbon-nitrogen hydrolase, partial [Acidimicrobiales bacterium]|nr:nitrilase-related carbon-nitrogen hydrolase [Acidimicrobiales bacterium]